MTAPWAPPPPYGGYGPPVRPPRRANTAGLVLAGLGGAAAVIGGLVPWYGGADDGFDVSDLVRALDAGDAHGGTKAWLSWALWTVLAVACLAALFANVPGAQSTPLRVLGPVLGVGGAIGTVVALNSVFADGHSFTENSRPGLWLVLAGFVVVGVAALLGPARARPGPYGWAPAGPPPQPQF